MLTIKKHVAERLHDKYASLVTEPALSCDDFAGFLEYPPDDKLGDLAFPCFRLSKELRKAPPVIASTLAEGLSDEIIGEATVAGGYLQHKDKPRLLRKAHPPNPRKGENTAPSTSARAKP